MKVRKYKSIVTGGACYVHWCPACECPHTINVEKPNEYGNKWSFNGDLECPTFNPSIHLVGACHYIIHGGYIGYLSGSRHKLRGQRIPLPDIPQEWEALA